MSIAQTQLANARISLFYDPSFVDTGPGAFSEATNVKQVLSAAGHVVTTFTGTDTNAWRTATVNADVLVIPPARIAAPVLSQGAIFVLKDFISKGGTLVTFAEYSQQANTDLIDIVFDTALNEVTGGLSNSTAGLAGTTFAGAIAALPNNDGPISALDDAALPTFAESLYEDAGGDSTVAAFQYGKGQVVWLGWDWFNAAPTPGTQDGGWNSILHRSISLTDLKPNGLLINGSNRDDSISVNPVLRDMDSTNRDDVVKLKKGNDTAFGGGGHDVINGDKGKDSLHGGDADDILAGGKGKDKLWGDGGGDYFLFDQRPAGLHADKVKDFVDGEDLIVLKQSRFEGLIAGDMSAEQFNTHIKYAPTGWLLYDGEKFARLQSQGFAIDQADFLVV